MDKRIRLGLLATALAAVSAGATLLIQTEPEALDAAQPERDRRGTTASHEPAQLVEIERVVETGEANAAEPLTPAPEVEAVRHVRRLATTARWLSDLLPDRFAELTPEALAQLEVLDLRGADITDADLARLQGLDNLKSINLRGTPITDAGLTQLSGLALTSLELRATEVTGLGLGQLPAHSLEALHLTDTSIHGDDLLHMPPMPNLEVLKLNRLEVDDNHLELLASYPRLRHVELDSSKITDTGLRRLMELNPNVTRLEIRDTAVSKDCVEELGQRYPQCEFVAERPQLRGYAFTAR